MNYTSTRNNQLNLSFTDTLLSGMESNGGLYIPNNWPSLKAQKIDSFKLEFKRKQSENAKPFSLTFLK